MSEDHYKDREQTKAKHIVLGDYLRRMAFIVLSKFPSLNYIDGFSGPWESRDEKFSDTSFGIAIRVLKEVQADIKKRTGKDTPIRCFFCEKDRNAFMKLDDAVRKESAPRFEIETFHGTFRDSIPKALSFCPNGFSLVFIDPTGWSGYPIRDIAPLFGRDAPKSEFILNFMYSFVERFVNHPDDPAFSKMLGENWRNEIEGAPTVDSVLELLRRKIKSDWNFRYVARADVFRFQEERIHFSLIFGTRERKGLQVFREEGGRALKLYSETRRISRSDVSDQYSDGLFGAEDLPYRLSEDKRYKETLLTARNRVLHLLSQSAFGIQYSSLEEDLLEKFELQPTEVKALCVALSEDGKVEKTWKLRNKKARTPSDEDMIRRP